MKLTLEPTDRIVELQGKPGQIVRARIWQGEDEHGTPVHAFVARVGVSNDLSPEVHARFAASLQETAPLRPDVRGIPLRFFID